MATARAAILGVLLAAATLCGALAPRSHDDRSLSQLTLRATDLHAFTEWGSGVLDCHPHAVFIDARDAASHQGRCYLRGFITDAALVGAGRAQLDATAQGYGYHAPPELPPLLPITGPFVSTHSGPFEIYCRIEELPSSGDAQREYERMSILAEQQYTAFQELPSERGDERQMVTGVVGPDPVNYETVRRERWRRGRFIVDLNVMGAPDLSQGQFDALASIVDARVQRAAGER